MSSKELRLAKDEIERLRLDLVACNQYRQQDKLELQDFAAEIERLRARVALLEESLSIERREHRQSRINVKELMEALQSAQKAVSLLKDLTSCGADDDYVARLAETIATALKKARGE